MYKFRIPPGGKRVAIEIFCDNCTEKTYFLVLPRTRFRALHLCLFASADTHLTCTPRLLTTVYTSNTYREPFAPSANRNTLHDGVIVDAPIPSSDRSIPFPRPPQLEALKKLICFSRFLYAIGSPSSVQLWYFLDAHFALFLISST